jgi:choice-of-anchor C domain-containing protein
MRKIAFMVACTFLMASGIAQANLIQNGNFASATVTPGSFATLADGSGDIAHWTVGSGSQDPGTGSIDYIGSYWQPSPGNGYNTSIDMNGNHPGTISQTFTTVANQRYNVTFDMAGNPDGASYGVDPIKTLGVSTTGNPLQTFTFDSAGKTETSMGWLGKNFTFTAIGNATTLTEADQKK